MDQGTKELAASRVSVSENSENGSVDAEGLSANVIVRLKEQWSAEYEQWNCRDLSGKQYVYFWADGMAETRAAACQAFDAFLEKYQAKYEAACECLKKDRDVLLTFYDFPAEHWLHLRTTNPIESTFATIRLRHRRTKGNGTRRTSLAMMFRLAQAAEKH